MCGIAGICFDLHNPPDGPSTGRMVMDMLNLLKHRGRSMQQVLRKDNCFLGHTRLEIVGGDTNWQPMEIDGMLLTFNGEIYNYFDLRTDLINRGRRFRTRGDAEVILNAYIVYGPSFVNKLRGIFAFALYDDHTKTLMLVRDRVGIKPLYYCLDSAAPVLSFSSEIKALLGTVIDPQDVAVDYRSLSQYLHFQHCLGSATLFRGIRKVNPGELLVFNCSTGDIRSTTYWSVDPVMVRGSFSNYYTEDYYKDRLLSVLHRVIREQAPAGVRAGVYVSGGIDSSTVASLLSEYVQDFSMFSGFYAVDKHDETPYVKNLVEHLRGFDAKNLHLLEITEDDMVDNLVDAIYHLDEPCAGPGLIGQYVLAKKLKQVVPDMKVMFGGQGGDELFGGYARYIVAYLEGCLHGAIYPSQRDYVMTLERIAPLMPVLQGYEQMLKGFLSVGLFENRDKRYFDLIGRSARSGLSEEFRTKFYDPQQGELFEEFNSMFSSLGNVSYFTKMTYFDFKASLPALLQVDDRVNGAFEMESRVPLLDEELIELAFSIPPIYKFSGGYTKGLLRRTLAGAVPDQILQRRDKMGFPVPMQEWLNGNGRAKDFITSCLDSDFYRAVFQPLGGTLKFDRGMWGKLALSIWATKFKVSL